MKVLQIVSEVNLGSVGRIAEYIGREVLSAGDESIIAYCRMASESKSRLIKIGNNLDIYRHVFETRILDRHGFASRSATIEFVQKMEEISPDIVHLHHLHGYFINIEILFEYLRSKNIIVVWTFHDCWSFTGHCAYYDFVACSKWMNFCFNCPQKKEYPKTFLVDRTKKNFFLKKELFTSIARLKIVTVSRWLENQVNLSFLRNYEKVTIYNGVDIEIFKHRESDFKDLYTIRDKFVILGVASPWVSRKGLKYFIELRKVLSDDFVIVLVGLNKNQITSLPEGILGIRKTDSTVKLAEIYSAADVFINPTLEDNFPTTNIESLACGTPVITFDTGGSPEAIDEKTGIVVPKGDIDSLLNGIYKIQVKGKIHYSAECRMRAERNFDSRLVYKKYIHLYEELRNY